MQEVLGFLRDGEDVLVVWRLDRLGRSLKDLIESVNQLEERKIGFKSLQDPVDTTSSSGMLVLHIFGALAEFERNLIRERTKAGLEAARARGKKVEGAEHLMGNRSSDYINSTMTPILATARNTLSKKLVR